MAGDFLTLDETAATLQVSARHARRLADSGAITRVARGLIERGSVDRYLASHQQSRTRSWAEHTAWGAIALLAGAEMDWLGATQTSRLRGTLRQIHDPAELLTRLRERADVQHYAAHKSALPHLREVVVQADVARLGLVDLTSDERIDGYIAPTEVTKVVRSLGLRRGDGNVTLRATGFDFTRVQDLVTGTGLVSALDAAESVDPRTRGVGLRALGAVLESYR